MTEVSRAGHQTLSKSIESANFLQTVSSLSLPSQHLPCNEISQITTKVTIHYDHAKNYLCLCFVSLTFAKVRQCVDVPPSEQKLEAFANHFSVSDQ